MDLHGNTKEIDYSQDENVIRSYRAPRSKSKPNHKLWWLEVKCCKCGLHYDIVEYKYRKKSDSSCSSCARAPDIIGERYNFVKVISLAYNKNGRNYWNYICDCGKQGVRETRQLKVTLSCGCKSSASGDLSTSKTHGMSKERVYKIWRGMIQRATNENNKRAEDYVSRGIGVDPSWQSFEVFFEDMGNPPTEEHTLERVDNNKGYSKDNCKWETRSRQQSNRRVSSNNSGRIGVSFCKQTTKWRVRLKCDKISIWLGRYEDFDRACEVIEQAELKYLGYSRAEGFIK